MNIYPTLINVGKAMATCAIRSGQPGEAVELLEEGHGFFWSQTLQLHTPIITLREMAPELERDL